MSLGDFIKARRTDPPEPRRRMSQKELAERAGVPLSTIQAMEQNKVQSIRLETARRIARVLGVTIDEMAEAAREGQLEPAGV